MKTVRIWHIALCVAVMWLPACGESSGLSRGKAEKIIEERVNRGQDYPTVDVQLGKAYLKMPEGDYRNDSVCFSLMTDGQTPGGFPPYTLPRGKWLNWGYAAEEGFITAPAEVYHYQDLGRDMRALKCVFKLSEKATPYMLRSLGDGLVGIKVVDAVTVKVTGLSKPSDMFGKTVSEVEFTYTYKLNPLGKALAEPFRSLSGSQKNGEASGTGKVVFQLYDDGWRLLER